MSGRIDGEDDIVDTLMFGVLEVQTHESSTFTSIKPFTDGRVEVGNHLLIDVYFHIMVFNVG